MNVSSANSSVSARTIWAVLSNRAGQTSQILALATTLQERFGWLLEVKRLQYRRPQIVGLCRGIGLAGVKVATSDSLAPPWPDLVISAGLENEPPCRWIRKRSAGQTRVVFIGRTWVSPQAVDLVITTPQYRLPEHPHVLQNRLSLCRIPPAHAGPDTTASPSFLANLPRPWTAVLLGGHSGPYVLGNHAIRALAEQLNARQAGSALVTTSSRTPPKVIASLIQRLNVPHYLYQWKAHDADNPYPLFLGLADDIVVTGDSIAMLSEAVSTGKPMYMLDLGCGPWSMGSRMGVASDREDLNVPARLYRLLMRVGHRRLTRDISLVHRRLQDAGLAAWLGEACPDKRTGAHEDMDAAVARVADLLADQDSARRASSATCSSAHPSTSR